jgi:hypothetical protein
MELLTLAWLASPFPGRPSNGNEGHSTSVCERKTTSENMGTLFLIHMRDKTRITLTRWQPSPKLRSRMRAFTDEAIRGGTVRLIRLS